MAHAPCGYAFSSLLSTPTTATAAASAISHRRIVCSSVVGLRLLCRLDRFTSREMSLKVPQERTPRMRGVSAMVCPRAYSTPPSISLSLAR